MHFHKQMKGEAKNIAFCLVEFLLSISKMALLRLGQPGGLSKAREWEKMKGNEKKCFENKEEGIKEIERKQRK